ncbi:UBN2 domain-containing protein [Salix suchowensis]|nr:UBN2 domain-containing protein [Salix suchowensis]
MNTLYCALNRSEFNRISSLTHEGTNQVKESKIDMLVHQYELFKMLQNESITSMFTRMTSITNSLHALEAKDLTKLPLEELIGSLMTHEITMDKQDQEERPKKTLAFKTVHQIESNDNDDDEDTTWSDDSDSSSSDEEEHVANMCFMAIESENEVLSSDDESDPSYIELHEQLENLYVEYKKLAKDVCLTKED